MSSVTEAIQALTAVIYDPDVDLDHEDRNELYVAIGTLTDYEDE